MSFVSSSYQLEIEIEELDDAISKQMEEGTFYADARPSMEKDLARRRQVELLCSAVILFQASMETIINMAYAGAFPASPKSDKLPSKPKEFWKKWIKALEALEQSTKAFSNYDKGFYKKYRNPLIHAGSGEDIQVVEAIDLEGVYCGIRSGWRAYGDLLDGLGISSTNDSWRIFCTRHRIPHDLYT